MRFDVVTLFPDMLSALNDGITGRALKNQLIQIHTWNPRDFTHNKHRTVDDRPYGGGPGMVMMAQPLQDAVFAAQQAAPKKAKVIHLSPQGRLFNQQVAEKVCQDNQDLILIAGRYEGIDERFVRSA